MSVATSCPKQGKSPADFSRLEEWLAWQETLHFTAMELGLARCRQVAHTMDLLSPSYRVLSVAGTNGKGSSVGLLGLILSEAGYRVGCYTSPHLLHYNERITVVGKAVDEAALCQSFARINQARKDISLTYFEFGTLAALDIFHREQVDIAVLEVGLGGSLDAVNILDADVALVTSIDLDHQHWLGESRECIAREKAGILRNNAPAICSDLNPPDSLLRYAEALTTPLHVVGRDFFYRHCGAVWDWQAADVEYRALPHPMPLCDHQIQNAAGVLMALQPLREDYPVTEQAVRCGLRRFHPPGRFQVIPGEFRVILDVAHNPGAMRLLVRSLGLLPDLGTTHIVLGLFKDKDRQEIYRMLGDVVDCWHLVSLSGERGCDAGVLAEEVSEGGYGGPVHCYEQVGAALDAISREASDGDDVVITGSFQIVGEALQALASSGF